MARAVIILEDDIEDDSETPTVNIKIKFFRNNEEEGTDDKSGAQHLGVKMLRAISEG